MDRVIYYRVMSILAEMGRLSPICAVDDFDPQDCIRNSGPYRFYDFHLEVRADIDLSELAVKFCDALEAHNRISVIKADFVELQAYPGRIKNSQSVYLTVATI